MKRLLAAGFLATLLAGCGLIEPNFPETSVNIGVQETATLDQLFLGSWEVTSAPEWLTVSPTSGQGNVRFTLNVVRPSRLDLESLQGVVRIAWTSRVSSGESSVNVTADMYRLGGQVVTPTVTSADVGTVEVRRQPQAPGVTTAGVIVKYRSSGGVLRTLSANGDARAGGGRTVLLPDGDEGTIRALADDPDVEYAVPNVVLRAHGTPVEPADQYASLQWAYRLVGYGGVWRDMQNAAYPNEVTVAVLDTGVRFDHPDLAPNLLPTGLKAGETWQGPVDLIPPLSNGVGDEFGMDLDPEDPDYANRVDGSHGTHVAGIIGAGWGSFTRPCPECSDSGVAGASYTSPVKVLAVRVLDRLGNGDAYTISEGIRYAAGGHPVTIDGTTFLNPKPARVINLSLGGVISETAARPLCEAITYARSQGALVFASAGNDGGTTPNYPAACPDAIAVASVSLGATAPERAPYSSTYAQVQLAAPGGNTANTYNGGTLDGRAFPDAIMSTSWNYEGDLPAYEGMVGTSQAAPQASALAALMISKYGLTADQTLERLRATVTDLGAPGRDTQYGYGMINAAAALDAPAVSGTPGVVLYDSRGNSFTLNLDAAGRFLIFPPAGEYRVIAGRDTNGNGIPGESGEPGVSATATLGPSTPSADIGTLTIP